METNRRFAESLELNYPILSDPDKAVSAAYGVLNEEGTYARRWTFYISKEGKLLAIDKAVQPSTSGADLLAQIERLGLNH